MEYDVLISEKVHMSYQLAPKWFRNMMGCQLKPSKNFWNKTKPGSHERTNGEE